MHQLPQWKLKGLELGPTNMETPKYFSSNEQENQSLTFIDNHSSLDVIIFLIYTSMLISKMLYHLLTRVPMKCTKMLLTMSKIACAVVTSSHANIL